MRRARAGVAKEPHVSTHIVRVFPQRQATDIVRIAVVRVPGCASERGNLIPVLTCENCGNVPTFDPAPDNPKVPVALQLNMVIAPDRDRPLFLGPECERREITRYLSREIPE